MIQLFDSGAYLLNGTEIIPDNAQAELLIKNKTGRDIGKEEAKKETIAFGILEKHNTSNNMDSLEMKWQSI